MEYELEGLRALVKTLRLVEADIRKTRQTVEQILRVKLAKMELEKEV